MLKKITEAIINFFNHRKKFKDTKVYNYRYNFIMTLIAIFIVSSICLIITSGEHDSQITTISIKWNYCTMATQATEEYTTTETTSATNATATSITTALTTTKKVTTKTTANTTNVEQTSKVATQGKLIGRFKITVYCSCAECCGQYAYNRPVDSNGNVIVKGASGRVLIPHYSIATDPSVIPSGKEVVINGKVYRADDTGSAVKGKVIDLYCGTDHAEALKIASQYSKHEEVYWK